MQYFINHIVFHSYAQMKKGEKWGVGLGKPMFLQAQGGRGVSWRWLKATEVGKCESCLELRLRGRVAGGGECAIH